MMHKMIRWIIHDKVLMTFILISSIMTFLDAFPNLHQQFHMLYAQIIYICMVYFLLEVSLKLVFSNVRTFFHNSWNQFDFCLVLISIPALIEPWMLTASPTGFLLLRIGRLVLLFKLLRFIPHGERIWHGVKNALKASIGVIFALFLLNFLFAMGAVHLFSDVAPQFFGDPISAMYSMFKVFTIEGWFEIPDAVAQQHPGWTATVIKSYFILAVSIGGIMGLSIANAIFIDEMTMDNTDAISEEIRDLRRETQAQTALLIALQAQLTQHQQETNTHTDTDHSQSKQ